MHAKNPLLWMSCFLDWTLMMFLKISRKEIHINCFKVFTWYHELISWTLNSKYWVLGTLIHSIRDIDVAPTTHTTFTGPSTHPSTIHDTYINFDKEMIRYQRKQIRIFILNTTLGRIKVLFIPYLCGSDKLRTTLKHWPVTGETNLTITNANGNTDIVLKIN